LKPIGKLALLLRWLAIAMFPLLKVERMSSLPRKPNFARHLRDARIKRGLSVADVAEQVGVSQSSIYFWETDYCRPRDHNLSALCKVLKLPVRATREMAAG
jgi:DNA-binding XRE family transcriptional regulator